MSLMKKARQGGLALPFVITAASCTVRPAPVGPGNPPPQQSQQTPKVDQSQGDPDVVSNPPRPQPTPKAVDPRSPAPGTGPAATTGETPTTEAEKPIIMRNPPPPTKAKYPDPPKSKGKVQTRADGTCWWLATPSCPKGASCNPPPPHQVNCPGATK